jgi:hypothetical protein
VIVAAFPAVMWVPYSILAHFDQIVGHDRESFGIFCEREGWHRRFDV